MTELSYPQIPPILYRLRRSRSHRNQPSFGKGTLLGEIGLFTRDGRRTMTARCKSDVQTAVIDYDRFKELYFQNPQFGFRLLHLVVARLNISREMVQPGVLC